MLKEITIGIGQTTIGKIDNGTGRDIGSIIIKEVGEIEEGLSMIEEEEGIIEETIEETIEEIIEQIIGEIIETKGTKDIKDTKVKEMVIKIEIKEIISLEEI